jgi:hypothetical protein
LTQSSFKAIIENNMAFKLSDKPTETNSEEESKSPTGSKETKGGSETSSKPSKTTKSEKKTSSNKKKKIKGAKALGPQIRVFYGHEINRFYLDDVWYYDISDFLTIGSVGDYKPFLETLKEDGIYDEIITDDIKKFESEDKNTGVINIHECVDGNTIIRFVKLSGKKFPGPTIVWIRDASNEPYVGEVKHKKTTTTKPLSPLHPSDGSTGAQ